MSHRARKRFGQNFLHDDRVIERIVAAIAPGRDDRIVEIGPGLGALTRPMLERVDRLDVVELDRDLAGSLHERLGRPENLAIHEADALEFDFRALAGPSGLRVIGNLPYNVSTPLMFHLLDQADAVTDMHFMLQKEVVQRMAAVPGENNYGRLGIMTQYFCRVQPLFEVGSGAFRPAPKVDSAIVRLVPHKTLPHPAKDLATLQAVVRTAFNARRKTLRKALGGMITAEQLQSLGINDGLRPENLALADYVAIADLLFEEKGAANLANEVSDD